MASPVTSYKYFILTGEPGVGKTTLTKKLSSLVQDIGVKTTGFYTEEVRSNRIRQGFDVVTLDGQRGRLARDMNLLNPPVKFRVGKYGVLIKEFEDVALKSLEEPQESRPHLLVIDEIGKMEFFSEPFKSRIREVFSPASNSMVLATIPIRKGDALIEFIRNHKSSKVWTVTTVNRNDIHESILKEIKYSLGLK